MHRRLGLEAPFDIARGPVRLQRREPLAARGGLDVLLELEEYARVTCDAESAACRIEPRGPRPGLAGAPPPQRVPGAVRSAGSSSTLSQWQEVACIHL